MKTTKLNAGVYQVIDTDWAIMNDSHKCWWVAKIVDGYASFEPNERFFISGSRNDAIQYAKMLEMNQRRENEIA